jgi:hypothetical protein
MEFNETYSNKTFKYLIDMKNVYYPYLIFSSSFVVLGTIGNLIVITSIFTNKVLMKNPTYIINLNLAFADIFIASIVNIFTCAGETLNIK